MNAPQGRTDAAFALGGGMGEGVVSFPPALLYRVHQRLRVTRGRSAKGLDKLLQWMLPGLNSAAREGA
jgi:hypothetical protein